jgi:Na+-translocating ferredoxin:NAD+ oxidoreductase RNF subunit RnfB
VCAGAFYKWLPVIDEDLCTGCGLCVAECNPNCLAVVKGIAMLICAQTCGSEEHCIEACPEDAIHMQWIRTKGDTNVGQWRIVVQGLDA